MHENHPKKDDDKVTGKVPKPGTGHVPHRGGGGAHKHRAEPRKGTRKQNEKKEIKEQSDP